MKGLTRTVSFSWAPGRESVKPPSRNLLPWKVGREGPEKTGR